MIAPLAALRVLWQTVGTAAALLTVPGSAELLLLSIGSLLPRRRSLPSPATPWRIAVVVPAHNEEAGIASTVASLQASNPGDLLFDIFVVADNCTDRTAEVARATGAQVLTRFSETERGKGFALHFAFVQLAQLGYDGVLIVDADTIVAPNFVFTAGSALRAGNAAVQVRYLVRNPTQSIRARLAIIALHAFNVVRSRGRERWGLSVGLLGNGFGLRMDTLHAVPYLATSVVEDLEYHLALIRHGFSVRFLDDTAVFGEVPTGDKGARTQRARWEGGRLRMVRSTVPALLRGVLHGRLRLLEPLLELLLLPLAFHVCLLLVACLTPLPLARELGLAGLAVVVLHLLAAVLAGGGWRDAWVLLVAPAYVLWKLMLIPSLLRHAHSDQAWVRTERNKPSARL